MMFLSPSYILANELVKKMEIHIANISLLRQEYVKTDDLYTIRKLNNCNFVNAKSHRLPKNIKKGIKEHSFTDVSDKLPVTFTHDEYPVTEREWFKSGVVTKKEKIAGKEFYVFSPDFVKNVTGKIGYVLMEDEYKSCLKSGEIQGGVELKPGKYFTWYSL